MKISLEDFCIASKRMLVGSDSKAIQGNQSFFEAGNASVAAL